MSDASLVRVKLGCKDEADFQRRFAGTLANKGLFVPSANARPVGSKVLLKIELGAGLWVVADAVVAKHAVQAKKPGMSLTLTRLHPESVQFRLEGEPEEVMEAEPLPQTPLPPSEPSAPAASPEPKSLDSLFDVPNEIPEELREESGRAVDPGERRAEVPLTSSARLPRKWLLVGAGAALLCVVVGGVVVASSGSRRGAARDKPAADPVADELKVADERLAAQRLVGPSRDEALDHLLAAKALAPGDPRVLTRLSALADRFEAQAKQALEAGDKADAAAALQAAVLADPSRTQTAQALEELEASVRSSGPKRDP